MKRVALFFGFMLMATITVCQQTMPSYVEVIKEFCSKYVPKDDYEDFTSFAKKKDGWYTQQVNRTKDDKLINEQLFYSIEQKKYNSLESFYSKAEEPDMDKLLEKFLIMNGGYADWYCFERIPYYGYTGWFVDLINDYGSKENLTDKELDGLGRAYDNLGSTFLWYQNGGLFPGSDTLHRKLGRLEYPSAQRISKLKEALDNGLVQFEKLSKLNPGYHTIVGNAVLKLFNEYMHGYNQMIMCNADELANQYLQKANLPEKYIAQAKNYLNSCEQNAILFTYGDNDTYQLWYVQEKYNYRKDVLVVNNSLLGIPIYIDMLKRKKLLKITIPASFLDNSNSDVTYFAENKKLLAVNKSISLSGWLNMIYTRKYPSLYAEGAYATYPYKQVTLAIPGPVSKKIMLDVGRSYTLLNDLAVYDIIVNNIGRGPVYFTSQYGTPFENNLIQKGIVYKLVADNVTTPATKAIEAAGLQKFYTDTYVPVTTTGKDFISFDGDNTFFAMHLKLMEYFNTKKDVANFKKWVIKLQQAIPSPNEFQMGLAKTFAWYYLQCSYKDNALKLMEEYAIWLRDAVNTPSALKGFYSRQSFLDNLKSLQQMLNNYSMISPTINQMVEKAE